MVGRTASGGHVRIVRALGRLSTWQDFAGGAGASHGFGTPKGGTLAAARHRMWSCRHARHVSRIVRTSALAVDVFATRRGRANQQCGRASVASSGDLAEAVVRHAECGRQPLCRDNVDRDRDLPPTAPQHLRLSDSRNRSSSESPTGPFIAPRSVNAYAPDSRHNDDTKTAIRWSKNTVGCVCSDSTGASSSGCAVCSVVGDARSRQWSVGMVCEEYTKTRPHNHTEERK